MKKKLWLRKKVAARKLEVQGTDWCQMRMISQGERTFLDLINEHGDLDPLFPATGTYHLLLVKCDKNVCQQNRTSERQKHGLQGNWCFITGSLFPIHY